MSVVLEDGTGVATANSYATVATADAYFLARNNTTWAAYSSAVKEAALLYAAQWLDSRYAWPGSITDTDQPLMWPREGAYDSEGRLINLDDIPQVLIDCQLEAAAASATSALNEVRDRGGAIENVKVEDIAVTFSKGAPLGRTFPYIDALMSRIAHPFCPGVMTMVRA